MGGFGSGRSSGSGRNTIENCRSLDISRLQRAGCLEPGRAGGWQWTRDGEQVAIINLRAETDGVDLSYRVRASGGEWQDVRETVRIVRVPCQFGGARPYFICPGVVNGIACERRVAKLYADGRYFLCRHCCGLAYASQREDEMDRALRRANKIRVRLGGQPGMASTFPDRPRGMWRRTYERLEESVYAAEQRADAALAVKFARLVKADQPRGKRSFWS
jgi:hypothetical protein